MVWKKMFGLLWNRRNAQKIGQDYKLIMLKLRSMRRTADHLNRFPNKERRLMLIKCTKDIKEWMVDNNTYPELIEWVPKHLL